MQQASTNHAQLARPVQPKRALGFRDLVMFYVVATLSLRWIAVAASAGPSSIVIWFVGLATIFIPLALCVMELSSRYPQEGGMYVWSKRAFGDFAGFMTGWIYWTSNLPYFPAVLYFAASNALYVGGTRWQAAQGSATFFVAFSLFGLGLALGLNVVGLNIGKWLSNLGAIGTWLPIALLCVVGAVAWWKFGSATSFSVATIKPSLNLGNFGVWATLLYAFSGAESASFMGDEIKDARRTIPRGLIVAGCHHHRWIHPRELSRCWWRCPRSTAWKASCRPSPAAPLAWAGAESDLRSRFLSARRTWALSAPISRHCRAFPLSPASTATCRRHLAASIQNGARRTSRSSCRRVCCVLFILMGQLGSTVRGAYQVLVSMTIITNFVPYLFMFAAMIRLQREPAEPGIIRVPGGKPVAIGLAIVGMLTTTAVIIGSVMPDASEPNKALAVAKIVGTQCGGARRRGSALSCQGEGERAVRRYNQVGQEMQS